VLNEVSPWRLIEKMRIYLENGTVCFVLTWVWIWMDDCRSRNRLYIVTDNHGLSPLLSSRLWNGIRSCIFEKARKIFIQDVEAPLHFFGCPVSTYAICTWLTKQKPMGLRWALLGSIEHLLQKRKGLATLQ
jgi:hypothetical protein